MNPQSSGAATGESEETALETAVPSSLGKEILDLMQGKEPKSEAPAEETSPAEKTEETATEETETETQEAETETEAEAEETDEEKPPKGDVWPDSAKKRVAEETEKRKKWKSAADKMSTEALKWKGRAEELAQRLQQSSAPQPSPKDPLADVYDQNSLKSATAHYQQLLETATSALDENPTESEIEIVVGKKDGEEVTKTFTRKQLSEMKRIAEGALMRDIPQREKYLVERAKMDSLAAKIYPQFVENEGNNEWFQTAQQLLAAVPELERIPDCWIWIGHALTGRQIAVEKMKKNGDVKSKEKSENSVVERIRSAPKVKTPPPVATRRVPSQSTVKTGADIEATKKRMKETGTDEAMEAFIGAVLEKGASRGYERVS